MVSRLERPRRCLVEAAAARICGGRALRRPWAAAGQCLIPVAHWEQARDGLMECLLGASDATDSIPPVSLASWRAGSRRACLTLTTAFPQKQKETCCRVPACLLAPPDAPHARGCCLQARLKVLTKNFFSNAFGFVGSVLFFFFWAWTTKTICKASRLW